MNESHTGRTDQKERTRVALLAAAAALIGQGKQPTVEEAADFARISKRTAYRYFVSQAHLLADASLEALRPVMGAAIGKSLETGDAPHRLAALAAAMNSLAVTHEPALRIMMRAALERGMTAAPSAPRQRGQRRLDWIETALEPVRDRLAKPDYDRLVAALVVSLGVDALIVLRDICGLDGDQVLSVMVWTAHSLLAAALESSKQLGGSATSPCTESGAVD
jgi:AcrR family transcriptional regulator